MNNKYIRTSWSPHPPPNKRSHNEHKEVHPFCALVFSRRSLSWFVNQNLALHMQLVLQIEQSRNQAPFVFFLNNQVEILLNGKHGILLAAQIQQLMTHQGTRAFPSPNRRPLGQHGSTTTTRNDLFQNFLFPLPVECVEVYTLDFSTVTFGLLSNSGPCSSKS